MSILFLTGSKTKIQLYYRASFFIFQFMTLYFDLIIGVYTAKFYCYMVVRLSFTITVKRLTNLYFAALSTRRFLLIEKSTRPRPPRYLHYALLFLFLCIK